MWNLKCTIIPVIIGATGIVTRSLRKNLEDIPGKHSIGSLQKTALLGTSHIIWKVLHCETGSLSGGYHCWLNRSTRKKRPVTGDDNKLLLLLLLLLLLDVFLTQRLLQPPVFLPAVCSFDLYSANQHCIQTLVPNLFTTNAHITLSPANCCAGWSGLRHYNRGCNGGRIIGKANPKALR
jgi:hypothetical protein